MLPQMYLATPCTPSSAPLMSSQYHQHMYPTTPNVSTPNVATTTTTNPGYYDVTSSPNINNRRYHQDPNDLPLCRYPSKRCFNLRAAKRNGDLHKLCEFHRIKANQNQRKSEKRKRIQSEYENSTALNVCYNMTQVSKVSTCNTTSPSTSTSLSLTCTPSTKRMKMADPNSPTTVAAVPVGRKFVDVQVGLPTDDIKQERRLNSTSTTFNMPAFDLDLLFLDPFVGNPVTRRP